MLSFLSNLDTYKNSFAVFIDENFSFSVQNKYIKNEILRSIKLFLNIQKNNKNKDDIFSLDISEKNKCFFIKIKNKKDFNYYEETGGKFYSFLKQKNIFNPVTLLLDSINKDKKKLIKFGAEFINGFNLKSYSFDKYKSLKNQKNKDINLNILTSNTKYLKIENKYFESIKQGVFLTRDLVSEPPNVLNPEQYVKEIKKLSKLGLKINVYNEKKMKRLNMNALLGVGQGSKNKSYLVTVEWKGINKKKSSPLAFVGKGVCFDTGGISLKPARYMEEMKYDMAGSAVVVGLLKTLALRKAKVNAIGVVGLVENMPGSNAQRPGDIVKSHSGKTIEVLNTDAEGRLVLADALSFTEKKFKPKFIIDLATLTGAIIIALGEEYAGMFSNNDKLSDQIFESSKKVNEKVWRLPLHKNYDKLMNSTIADVQNINYVGGAGSITAAQFLQRFISNKTPWVHLDIAGMAFQKKAANLNPGGATGFGVRLLNNLIKENYE